MNRQLAKRNLLFAWSKTLTWLANLVLMFNFHLAARLLVAACCVIPGKLCDQLRAQPSAITVLDLPLRRGWRMVIGWVDGLWMFRIRCASRHAIIDLWRTEYLVERNRQSVTESAA